MRCALLCNGPSRVAFNQDLEYNYIIGCNIPWTKVDATVILDKNVLDKWQEPCSFYISRDAWRECNSKLRQKFIGNLQELIYSYPEYDSAGHAACRKLLELGATSIDIYGCDSWFTNNTESYTHKYVDSRSEDMSKNVSMWKVRWNELMINYPDVKFNFIGVSK